MENTLAKRTLKSVESVAEASPPAQQTGSFMRRLQKPESVGSVSAVESLEIRARNELIKDLAADATKAQRVYNIALNERLSFVRGLVSSQGLDPRNEYSVDDQSGVITMTSVFVEQETVAESLEAEEEPSTEA